MNKEETLVNILMEKGYHIVFAESCTAGLAAARLVNVPNASTVLDVSFITYANEAKIKLLGVNPETIDSFGVVSEEVAGEMAEGAAVYMVNRDDTNDGALVNADGTMIATDGIAQEKMCQIKQIGVGISGIAGPGGGTPEKPVGTVSFGISIGGKKARTWLMHFGNPGRAEVRNMSVEFIYDRLIEELKGL